MYKKLKYNKSKHKLKYTYVSTYMQVKVIDIWNDKIKHKSIFINDIIYFLIKNENKKIKKQFFYL